MSERLRPAGIKRLDEARKGDGLVFATRDEQILDYAKQGFLRVLKI